MEEIETLKQLSFIRGGLQAVGKILSAFSSNGLINKETGDILNEIFNDYQNQYEEINSKTGSN